METENISIRGWVLGRLLRVLVFGSLAAFIIWLCHLVGRINNEMDSSDGMDSEYTTEMPFIEDSK